VDKDKNKDVYYEVEIELCPIFYKKVFGKDGRKIIEEGLMRLIKD